MRFGAIIVLMFVSLLGWCQVEGPTINIDNPFELYDVDIIDASFFKRKRDDLRSKMPENSLSVIFSSPIRVKSNDIYYPFHQDPNFYYLTGLKEPNAVLIIFKNLVEVGGVSTNEIIFIQSRNPKKEIWEGKRLGENGALKKLDFQMAKLNTEFADFNFNFDQFDHLYYLLPNDHAIYDDKLDRGDVASMVKHFALKKEGVGVDKGQHELRFWMGQLREVKEIEELEFIQTAVDMTVKAQLELMKLAKPGMKEFELAAVAELIIKARGAEQMAFPSVVGSGENSCVLHYSTNRKEMESEDLVVVDIGAEYHGYCSDITRTFPVSGKFTSNQKALYEIVLKAQNAAINKCWTGNKFWDPEEEATKIIFEGLKELGIVETIAEVKKFFMHGTSHYLGLDVHDPGEHNFLKDGNVISIEPGIYIPEGSDCDPKWWNMGIRIEDNILITEKGPIILSKNLPRLIEEIERIMDLKSSFEGVR